MPKRPGSPFQQRMPAIIQQDHPPLHDQARSRTGVQWIALGLIIIIGFIASCAIDPVKDAERLLDTLPPNALAEARRLERDHQPVAAADAYLALAETTPPPARQQLELEAARTLLQASDVQRASRILLALDQAALTASQRQAALLLQADIALSRGRAEDAISALDRVNQGTLPANLKQQYLGSLAAAYRLSKAPVRAAETLDQLDRLLDSPKARLDNQVSLLFTLTSLNKASLAQAEKASQGRMRGWTELATILAGQSRLSPELNASLKAWQLKNRAGHPALAELAGAYFATLAGGYAEGTKALVLLPTSGQFGAAGGAIKDGIMAAYQADRSGTRPQLSFGSDSASAYASRIEDGANLVIGPLQRASVSALASQGALPVPTLALNRISGATPENLFQFSLAPEDEAFNVANYAFAAGLKRAALVYPQSAWGARMADAFRSQWRALGGTLVAQPSYGAIRDAAESLAGSDAQVLFLVATTKNIAALWEALQMSGVKGPVIATSHVYEGTFNRAQDPVLAGLYFVDIPWLLDQQRSDQLSRRALQGTLGDVSGPLARLYAMGIDAYRLAPRVTEMSQQPGTFFPGETGGLSIDARGQVRRQLTLARFTRSGIVTLERISDDAPEADGD
ncbi:MAG: penicillin-binding protein activator [Lamprobacter sp.]|uniref:penicillin-binding protein activator n=1 Tax=Lamprobacter sp. TaxID=3100796 RepID=UPI002B26273B|nr:penicillin-binding protein activator [Lamprobacter sp.]MEA3640452.1 penicillin-binding protein activator [Lamprobacter sp.]